MAFVRHSYPHFRDEETEAERGKMTCPRPCSKRLQSWDSNSNSNCEPSSQSSIVRSLVSDSATLAKTLPSSLKSPSGKVTWVRSLILTSCVPSPLPLESPVCPVVPGHPSRANPGSTPGLRTSSISIAWKLVRNAEPQAHLHLNMTPELLRSKRHCTGQRPCPTAQRPTGQCFHS